MVLLEVLLLKMVNLIQSVLKSLLQFLLFNSHYHTPSSIVYFISEMLFTLVKFLT